MPAGVAAVWIEVCSCRLAPLKKQEPGRGKASEAVCAHAGMKGVDKETQDNLSFWHLIWELGFTYYN